MKLLVIERNYLRNNKIFTILKSLRWDLLIELDSFEKAEEHLYAHTPDLVIVNISLDSENIIKQFIAQTTQKRIPVLFLMAIDNGEDYNNFLLNFFNQEGVNVALNLLTTEDKVIPLKGIEIRGKQQQKILIPFEDILWIEVDRNYCFIKTQNNRYGLITSLSKLLPSLDERFIQIHRGCIINSDYIDLVKMSQQELRIKNTTWPIGRLYKANVMAYLANKR